MQPMVTIPRKKNWFSRHKGLVIFLIIVVLAIAGVAGGIAYSNRWYEQNIQPLSSETKRTRVTIAPGSTAAAIAAQLEQEGVIKNARAFNWYVDRNGLKQQLQAGTYLLSPSQSVAEIADIIANGRVDQFQITITPGQRLDSIRENLIGAGFEEQAVDAALQKQYDHPLFAGKPEDMDLEGYIYPETYAIGAETTVEDFLIQAFDEFYRQIEAANILDTFAAQGLSLYEAITLASIVQLEVSNAEDQAMVAQVFLRRLNENMPLGADPTFKYAAYKLGVEPTIYVDSPYNTRIYPGLPPGPLANFNLQALIAVAEPADTDYLYFVAGDDGTTHFSHTQEEHERLTREYCTELCQ